MQQLGVSGQSPNFKPWAQRWGPELDVMDNPSSVITQVSRDEEGSKAAADRGGESPLISHVKKEEEGKEVEEGKKFMQLRKVDNTTHRNAATLRFALCWVTPPLRWSLSGETVRDCAPPAYLTAAAPSALRWKWRKWRHNFGLKRLQMQKEQLFCFLPEGKGGSYKWMQFSHLLSLFNFFS